MSGEVTIKSIGTAVGSRIVDNVAQAAGYDRNADFVRTRLGPIELPEATEDETAVGLATTACQRAMEEAGVDLQDIGLLIFVSQNPDLGGLPHNSAVLHGILGLPTTAACFDVGLGCSGFVYGLSIAEAMLNGLDANYALLVTSDQYRKHLKPGDGNTQLLFGDGAAATLLSRQSDNGFRYIGARLGTDGTKHNALLRDDDGILMSGRAIYGFSRKVIPAEISELLNHYKLERDEIDAFLLHQGSRAIVDEIAKELAVPQNRVPVAIEKTGNTVSSSIPFMLKSELGRYGTRRILLAGFGVGLSWGIALLER